MHLNFVRVTLAFCENLFGRSREPSFRFLFFQIVMYVGCKAVITFFSPVFGKILFTGFHIEEVDFCIYQIKKITAKLNDLN